MEIARVVLLWIVALPFVQGGLSVFNILDYGATGNGKREDNEAFLKTWRFACASHNPSTLLVPYGKTFLLGQVIFQGPCLSDIDFKINGNIVAPNRLWTKVVTNLLTFININRLTVDGWGQIDGRGAIWWPCLSKKTCKGGPATLAFLGCKGVHVTGIKIKDSPGKQMTIYKSQGVYITGVTITAPRDSPNTDGILITESKYVHVINSIIGTGDDCISIGPGSSDVNISRINCGPGHGISIGSLGAEGTKQLVERIRVTECNIFETLTGVRIKTWQGGSGIARHILFQNINFTSVKAPIVIDQFYCPQGGCPNKTSSVAVSNVRFINLKGSSLNEVAINLSCSQNVDCTGIVLADVNLYMEGSREVPKSYCINARGESIGQVVPPVPCLG